MIPVPFPVPHGTGSTEFNWDPEPVLLGRKRPNVPEPVPSGSGSVPPLAVTQCPHSPAFILPLCRHRPVQADAGTPDLSSREPTAAFE